MTVNVTENPIWVPRVWDIPPARLNTGIPRAEGTFSNVSVVIPEATAEITAISINCGLPIGYGYRFMDARVLIAGADLASMTSWGSFAEGQIVAFNPTVPGNTVNIPFSLKADWQRVGNQNQPTPADASSLPLKIMYGPQTLLPGGIITAESATTVVRLFIASLLDDQEPAELTYYLRFLQYDIQPDDQNWRIHTPFPVTR